MNHHSKTLYTAPGRRKHLELLIADIDAEIADLSKIVDSVSSTSAFMARSGPVGGNLGSGTADKRDAFRWIRGALLAEKLELQDELDHTVEALAAEEDLEKIERRARQIEIEVASRREQLARAIQQFIQQNDFRAAGLYSRERAMVRATVEKEFPK